MPGNASGSMDGLAVKPLTADFHEGGFLSKLNQENQIGLWFQLGDEQRQQAGSPWGPSNPQALNRYSYVHNNPLRYTDPTGHCPACAAVAGVLGAAGITVSAPVVAVIAAVGSVALLAVFLSDAGNRDWLSTQIASGVSSAEEFGASLEAQLKGSNVYQAKGEYVPPGLSARERQKYREAVHRYKRTWGLRANQNVPRDILDQMAGAIRDGASADDAADMADSPPEAD